MLHAWGNYLFFLLKSLTFFILAFIFFAAILSLFAKNKPKNQQIELIDLNQEWKEREKNLNKKILSKKAFKQFEKNLKSKKVSEPKRIYLLNFHGDLAASAVEQLREEITTILQIAQAEDEVVLKLESPGGMVQAYGLAAAQLARLKNRDIRLTVCIDKVAASGGYLMACVADHIIAAPFAIVGSIGVLAQIPNFHRLLKKHNIDFEQITAGNYKRTLTLFGKNTEEDREKMQADLNEIHKAFMNYIMAYRKKVSIQEVATGEYWLAVDAIKLNLIDELLTSDDYLFKLTQENQVYSLSYMKKKSFWRKWNAKMKSFISSNLTKL